MEKKKGDYFLNPRCKMHLVFSRLSLVFSEEKTKKEIDRRCKVQDIK